VRHHVTHILPYTPGQLFRLVGDVEAYPQFVPWITALRTWNARTLSEGVDAIDAEASVGFAMLRERFSTRVRRDAPACQIDVDLIAGPFRKLQNRWRFIANGDGATQVVFDIDFEFKSRLLERVLAANLARSVARLIACFEDRAKALYG